METPNFAALNERKRTEMADMVTIREEDLIDSVADALQHISY